MKNFIFITFLCFTFTNIYTQEQAKEAFKIRMNNHVANYIENEIDMTKAREKYGHTCLEHHIVHDEEVISRAAEAEKHSFIVNNMGEYKRLFFPQTADRFSTDTLVCDNGGFEDDFLYYKGFSTVFDYGSTTCSPTWSGNPSTYVPATLPTAREFEIVTSGTDAITGLQKVKFGNKALKLNDPYNHINGNCNGSYGVNKIVKRFKVTEETRDFTVWYSLALENPPGHGDRSPWFNISCDLAPLSELCFDANILQCDSLYSQPGCFSEVMDVLDWSCHRIKIPASEIGNIATLEIIVGDCGASAHNGYAYIDGMCEECTGSALGSIQLDDPCYNSCDAQTAMICGSFTYPTLCGNWTLDSLVFPDLVYDSLMIDTFNGVFCFNLPISSFGMEDCLELSIEAYFSAGTINLPAQLSNTVEICKEFYEDSDLDDLISYISDIDSLCDGCFIDTLGSVKLFNTVVESGAGILYRSCDGEIATICGEVKYPTLCHGNWVLDSLVICGIEIENLFIANESFCFDVPLSSFGEEDCLSFKAKAYFRLDTLLLPVRISDTIEICKEFYEDYDYGLLIGECHDNGTEMLLSDDYYFIRVTLTNVLGANWNMWRRLNNPYPNENGLYSIATGSGDTVIILGPFLIQEGGWDLAIDLPGCQFVDHIDPPACLSDCVFAGYTISDIDCQENGSGASDDTWSFKLLVPGSGNYTVTTPGGPEGATFGTPVLIDDLPLTTGCITFTLRFEYPSIGGAAPEICFSQIIVCPPKPCDDELNCVLEVYVDEISCDENGEYSFVLDVIASPMGKILCYETVDHLSPTDTNHDNYYGPSTTPPTGPFDGDIQLIVRLCDGPTCSSCDDECFKVLYIPQPDCSSWDDDKTEIRTLAKTFTHELKVYPNPFTNNEFTIESSLQETTFQIYTLSGVLVTQGKFKGTQHVVSIQSPSGMYIMAYKDRLGNFRQIKIVKL